MGARRVITRQYDPWPPSFPGEWRYGAAFLALVVLVLAARFDRQKRTGPGRAPRADEIEYRGKVYKLTKPYDDYDDYKNDPDNLAPAEIPRVEAVMLGAKLPETFPDIRSAVAEAFRLKFPGYGVTSFEARPQADGTTLHMVSVEVPRRDKDRYFVFRAGPGRVRLVDDFVYPTAEGTPPVVKVADVGGRLTYYDPKDQVVPVRGRPPQPR